MGAVGVPLLSTDVSRKASHDGGKRAALPQRRVERCALGWGGGELLVCFVFLEAPI